MKMYSWISKARDPEGIRRQGDEPRDGAEEYLVRSEDWEVFADGEELPVLAVPVTSGGPHSFVCAEFKEGRKITVIPKGRKLCFCTVSPKRMQLPLSEEYGNFSFLPPKPGHYVIQADGGTDRPLTVSLEYKKPVPAGITKYFAAGPHRVHAMYGSDGIDGMYRDDTLELEDGDVIYLEEGAVIEAVPPPEDEEPLIACDWAGQKKYRPFWSAAGKKNIRITGHGILDLSGLDWHARNPLVFSDCENIIIDSITVIGAPEWTLTLDHCRNVQIQDLKIYGHRENSDGIDICSCEEVEVSNCFVRTGDDAICLKGLRQPPVPGGLDIYVHGCVIWNDKVRCLGIASETRNDISHVLFSSCDIIHSTAVWTEELGSLCIIVCDQGEISDITFEDIWIEQESMYAVNCMIMKDKWSVQKEPGKIRNIVFRGIHAPAGVPLNFLGFDREHGVEDILIEDYWIGDRMAASAGELPIERNEFVKNFIVKKSDTENAPVPESGAQRAAERSC